MDLSNANSESFALKLAVAKAVAGYTEGKELPNKLIELLKTLLYENMREGVTDEQMADLLEEECDKRKLDPEEVMEHFAAIGEGLQNYLQ